MITVVNKRTAKRNDAALRIYIGRPSPLGNPFTHIRDKTTLAKFLAETREDAVEKYSQWLGTTDRALAELLRIRNLSLEHDIELECWCAPLSCHGDVIKKVIEEWK